MTDRVLAEGDWVVEIDRRDADGAVRPGTAVVSPGNELTATTLLADGQPVRIHDFRYLDGRPMELPPGSTFHIELSDLGFGPR